MARASDPRLGWQGWLWLIIFAICLGGLALGLGYRYGAESPEGSAGAISSGAVPSITTNPPSDPQPTINVFPVSTVPRASGEWSPDTSDDAPNRAGGQISESVPPGAAGRQRGSGLLEDDSGRPGPSMSERLPSDASTVASPGATSSSPRDSGTSSTTAPTPSSRSTTVAPTTAESTTPPSTTAQPPPEETTTTAWTGPVAADDHLAVDEGKEIKPKVLENDAGGAASLDEDSLAIVSGPNSAESHRVHGDHLHYRPAEGFVGVDRIGYRICDQNGLCDTATVVITVG